MPAYQDVSLRLAEIKGNLHQLLKRKQLCSAVNGVYTEVLHDLKTVLKESVAKRETAKSTITEHSSNEEFRGSVQMTPTIEPRNQQRPPRE